MTQAPAPSSPTDRPLSEKPQGYLLAVLGGLLGGGPGLIASPLVLFGLNKVVKKKDDKQPNRFLRWALIGIIGAPFCVGIQTAMIGTSTTGGSSSPSSSGSSSQVAPSTDGGQAAVGAIKVGTEDLVREDRSLTVTGSEEHSSISSSNQFMDPVPAKGGKLIAVFMTIKNTGNESGNMFWTDFKLVDSQGRKYDDVEDFTEIMTINDWAKGLGLADNGDQLFPGATAKTVAVFRVAPDAEGLQLLVNDNRLFDIK